MPTLVTKRKLIHDHGVPPKYVARMAYHGWLTVAIRGGRGRATHYDGVSAVKAIDRLRTQDIPPLLPSEVRWRQRRGR